MILHNNPGGCEIWGKVELRVLKMSVYFKLGNKKFLGMDGADG
jgi:hypothetical protein